MHALTAWSRRDDQTFAAGVRAGRGPTVDVGRPRPPTRQNEEFEPEIEQRTGRWEQRTGGCDAVFLDRKGDGKRRRAIFRSEMSVTAQTGKQSHSHHVLVDMTYYLI